MYNARERKPTAARKVLGTNWYETGGGAVSTKRKSRPALQGLRRLRCGGVGMAAHTHTHISL